MVYLYTQLDIITMYRTTLSILLVLMIFRFANGKSPVSFSLLNPFSPLQSPVPPPDTICKGDTLTITVSHPLASSFTWTPNYNISSTSGTTVHVYPQITTPYVVNMSGLSSNLIFNGDFTFGNLGFTSSYTYTTNLWPEATYCIGTNPQTFHTGFAACGDHTTGTGNMMVVNGAGTPNTTIWQQTVPVVPNTNYQFSCWLASVHTSSPAQL